MSNMNKKIAGYILLGIFAFGIFSSMAASTLSEEKMLSVGSTWEKDGWNLSIKAIDKTTTPGFILISLSYQNKNLGDARIKSGKSYIYKGKNPDGSEVPLLTIKAGSIFVGASVDTVKLELNWSVPANDVQIIEVPVEYNQTNKIKIQPKNITIRGEIIRVTEVPMAYSPLENEMLAPTSTAQASPEAPGFEMAFGIMGVLAVRWRLKK